MREPVSRQLQPSRHQERRRSEALERQSTARRDILTHARRLAESNGDEPRAAVLEQGAEQQQVWKHDALPATDWYGCLCCIFRRLGVGSQAGQQDLEAASADMGSGPQEETPPRRLHNKGVEVRDAAGMRAYYAHQLMQPEWLVDVPTALAASWCSPPWSTHPVQACVCVRQRGTP